MAPTTSQPSISARRWRKSGTASPTKCERSRKAYKSDYEIARTREQSLKDSLANAVTVSQTSNQAQVQLRELTSNAETSRALYDHFLQRYMETVQQQDAIPISETRMISPAFPPPNKSSPKTTLTLALALAGGGLLSFAVAYLREASDGVFRTSDQIENTLHVNCLAMAPMLKTGAPAKDGGGSGDGAEAKPRAFLRNVVDAPFSRYAEAVRSVKIAADLNGALKSHKVIGVTSTLPNEGKSTLSANLAHLIADAGGRVLLLDGDLRSPSLSRWLAPDAPGLIDVVIGNVSARLLDSRPCREAGWTSCPPAPRRNCRTPTRFSRRRR